MIDLDLCKGCGICVDICPKNALVLSDTPGPRGYRNPKQIGECIGCRICEWFCPDFAIVVRCEE